MTTAARVHSENSSHWYATDGKPVHSIMKKDGSGPRPTNLGDARKQNLLPSVTSVLKILDKPQLVSWLCEQAALAVLTAPRQKDEELDAFVNRVLSVEKQQDQERDEAARRGTMIHDALAGMFTGEPCPEDVAPYVVPVYNEVRRYGSVEAVETVLVGAGYAGTTDLVLRRDDHAVALLDFKSSKKLPDDLYEEHRMQLGAYARAWGGNVSMVANVFIDRNLPGQFKILENPNWRGDFEGGFVPALRLWQWKNNYAPKQ